MKLLLFILIVATVVFAFLYFSLKSRIIKVEDSCPEKPTKKNMALKLQNEIAKYVGHKDGKVFLYIVKSK